MKLRTACLLLLSLVGSLAGCASLPAQQDTELRIGSWNLEFFGSAPSFRSIREKGQPTVQLPGRTDEDIAKIGAAIRELGVSALFVQEIGSLAALEQLAQATGPAWRAVLGTTGRWDDGKTAQSVGFLYEQDRLELLWAEELLDLPRERDGLPIFHRVPVTACLRDRATGMDFRAVVVHLKASQGENDKKKRKFEAEALRDWLLELRGQPNEDPDVVVLGDFNCTYGAEPQAVFEEAGVVRYLNQVRPEPTIMHFDDPIDQIAPSPQFAEVLPRSFDAHGEAAAADKVAWRTTYSDHFPVTVTLHAHEDDDPRSQFWRGPIAHRLPEALRDSKATKAAEVEGPAFAAGTSVIVRTGSGKQQIEGVLIEPLGAWVVLRTDDGRTVALPATKVFEIARR